MKRTIGLLIILFLWSVLDIISTFFALFYFGLQESNGSVVLAVTPFLKARGVKSRCRVFELPDDPTIIFAKPRMKKYLEFSTRIIEIYLKYVSYQDMHVYSVDEVFLDLPKKDDFSWTFVTR